MDPILLTVWTLLTLIAVCSGTLTLDYLKRTEEDEEKHDRA